MATKKQSKTEYEFAIPRDDRGYCWIHNPTITTIERFVTGDEALNNGWEKIHQQLPPETEQYTRRVDLP